MSLTSYRAAPPRVKHLTLCRSPDLLVDGLASARPMAAPPRAKPSAMCRIKASTTRPHLRDGYVTSMLRFGKARQTKHRTNPGRKKPPRKTRRLLFLLRSLRRAFIHRDEEISVLCRPGSDLLFQVLRLSTIGAGKFNGRVRNGIGFRLSAKTTRPAKDGNEK